MCALLVHSGLLVAVIPVAVLAFCIDADAPVARPTLSKARVERLEKQVADLASRIPVLQKMLDDARAELREGVRPPAMTPIEAVESFKTDPKKVVTVEFGVQPIGSHSDLVHVGDDPAPPMILTWDNHLPGGGTFTAIVPGRVYRQLADFPPETLIDELAVGEDPPNSLRRRIARHIEANGVRIIGVIEKHDDNYGIRIHDPGQVITYIKNSGALVCRISGRWISHLPPRLNNLCGPPSAG